MIKLTNESFIQKAIKKHGDRYGYPNTKYVDAFTKVKIVCKIHGEFEQKASYHLMGNGCQQCGKDKNRTTESEISRFKKIHGDTYDYSLTTYVANRTKMKIICKKHGVFMQTPMDHKHGKGCGQCGLEREIDDQDYVLLKFKEKHGNTYDYSKTKYTGVKNKITITCRIHGDFEQNVGHHSNGVGCPLCSVSGFKSDKPAELYLYNINDIYLGYGITGDVEKRHRDHTRTLTKAGFKFKHIKSFSFELGSDALELENYIKTKFNNMDLGVTGFRKECISIDHLDTLLTEIPALIEKHDKRSV